MDSIIFFNFSIKWFIIIIVPAAAVIGTVSVLSLLLIIIVCLDGKLITRASDLVFKVTFINGLP